MNQDLQCSHMGEGLHLLTGYHEDRPSRCLLVVLFCRFVIQLFSLSTIAPDEVWIHINEAVNWISNFPSNKSLIPTFLTTTATFAAKTTRLTLGLDHHGRTVPGQASQARLRKLKQRGVKSPVPWLSWPFLLSESLWAPMTWRTYDCRTVDVVLCIDVNFGFCLWISSIPLGYHWSVALTFQFSRRLAKSPLGSYCRCRAPLLNLLILILEW